MKRNTFIGFLLVMVIVLSNTSFLVRAEDEGKEENDDNIVTTILYDADGKRIEIKERRTLIPDGEITHYTDVATDIYPFWDIFNNKGSLRGTLNYNSTLGVYNSHTLAHAQSNATEPINTMVVSCRAYYKSQSGGEGSLVDVDTNTNPPGTTVMALSANVEVPSYPVFSPEIFSAYSTHDYHCEGYIDVHKELTWTQ